MSKLTELPEALSLPTNTKVYIVDTDDTTDDPAGTSKQMDAALLGGGATTGEVKKIEIARITDPGAGGFVFSNIPQDYDRIILKGQVRTTEAVTAARVFVNGDVSDSGYHQQVNGAFNGGPLVTEASNGAFTITSSTSQAGHYASLEVSVEGYAESRENVVVVDSSAHYATTDAMKGFYTIGTNDITPLTQLQIKEHDGTGGLLGTLILYGEKTL